MDDYVRSEGLRRDVFGSGQMTATQPSAPASLLYRTLLIWPQSGGAHDPGVRGRVCREGLDRSPPAQIAREVLGGDAMEAPHPLLQPAVVGVHVVDMEIWRLRLRRAGCGQDMELDPGAWSEGGNRRTPIAAQFRWLGDD